MSLGSLSELSELSSELPPAADFFGFLEGAPPPLPPLAVLVRVVDCCRPVFSVGPSAAPGVEGGTIPPRLARASRSALSSGSSLVVHFFVLFLIFCSKLIARSATITGFGVNSQSMRSVCSFGMLGTTVASAPSLPILSCMTFMVMLNMARCRYSISRLRRSWYVLAISWIELN